MKLLGYDQTEVRNKLATVFHGKKEENGTTEEDADDLEVKNSLKDVSLFSCSYHLFFFFCQYIDLEIRTLLIPLLT